jgi:hypothetical protein
VLSLRKFFSDKFGTNVEAKKNAVRDAYFYLSKESWGELILADLLEQAACDFARQDLVDSNKLAYVEGARAIAYHFRHMLETSSQKLEGKDNGRTKQQPSE